MFCSHCGKQIPDNAEFCSYCGSKTSSEHTNAYDRSAPLSAKMDKNKMRVMAPACALIVITILVFFFVIIPNKNENSFGKTVKSLSDASVRDLISYGKYEQDNNSSNGKEDIIWIVLVKENNRMLVVSKYALDCLPYNNKLDDVTWETCTIRKWLNNEFLNSAFSEKEKTDIPIMPVSADKNPYYEGISAGKDTEDQVFLLSAYEGNEYFSPFEALKDDAQKCSPTEYTKSKGVYTRQLNKESQVFYADKNEECDCWSRTPGDNQRSVVPIGYGWLDGYYVNSNIVGVRPAMWITF